MITSILLSSFQRDGKDDFFFFQGKTSRPESPVSGKVSKRHVDVVASSTALILENRPPNLPAKPQEEEMKHRQEYEQMVEAARKKGIYLFQLRFSLSCTKEESTFI